MLENQLLFLIYSGYQKDYLHALLHLLTQKTLLSVGMVQRGLTTFRSPNPNLCKQNDISFVNSLLVRCHFYVILILSVQQCLAFSSTFSVANRALRHNLLTEISVAHRAKLVLVELIEGRFCLLAGDVEATAFNNALDFTGINAAIVFQVERIECLVHIEARIALQALTDSLSSSLNLEMHTPHISELNLGVCVEAIVTAVDWVSMV